MRASGNIGNLGRAEIVLSVMADDQVLDHRLELIGKAGLKSELGLQHLQFDDHVAEQLSLGRVGKRTIVGELVNLADVVEKSACEQEIAIDVWIVFAHQIAGPKQRHDMIKQADRCMHGAASSLRARCGRRQQFQDPP